MLEAKRRHILKEIQRFRDVDWFAGWVRGFEEINIYIYMNDFQNA